jgi:hypothetical protein
MNVNQLTAYRAARTDLVDWLIDIWCKDRAWHIDLFTRTINVFDAYLDNECHLGVPPPYYEWKEIVCTAWFICYKILNGPDNHEQKMREELTGKRSRTGNVFQLATCSYFVFITGGSVTRKQILDREVHMLKAFDWQIPYGLNIATAFDYNALRITDVWDVQYELIKVGIMVLSRHIYFTRLDAESAASVLLEVIQISNTARLLPAMTPLMRQAFACYQTSRNELRHEEHPLWEYINLLPCLQVVYNNACLLQRARLHSWRNSIRLMESQTDAEAFVASVFSTPTKRELSVTLNDQDSDSGSSNKKQKPSPIRPSALTVY